VRPSIVILSLTAVGVVTFFAALGRWQLQRADEQAALERAFSARALAPAHDALPAQLHDELRYARVELRGRYAPDIQILLDNMTHEGVVGYHVLTPFVTAGGETAVVNRGFVRAPPDRRELPRVGVAAEERVLRGTLDALPVPALRLQGGEAPEGAAVVMSFPTSADLERVTGRALRPYQVLLDASQPDGYVRVWGPPGPDHERNIAYAGQWFALAGVTALAFLVAALGPRFRRHRT
jgi:surfeit locus 1 family protein